MKHERNVTTKWRLRRTLARKTVCRAFEDGDMRYLWAAYKKGALAGMGERFADGAMEAEEFKAAFEDAAGQFADAWIVETETKRGLMPSGVVLSAYTPGLSYRVVGGIAWFPWASRRNVIEGTVSFFNQIRKTAPMILYANGDHKRLYEVVCMHGIMRRIGTSNVVFPGHAAAVFETRAP